MPKVATEVKVRTTNDWFGKFAASASGWLGSKWAFSWAVLVILVWGATVYSFIIQTPGSW
jgi:low affinity Fe/Cu permease